MALDSTVLRDLIVTKMGSQFGEIPEIHLPVLQQFAQAIAEAVTEHVAANTNLTLDYTIDNVVETRVYDTVTVTLPALASVVGTLISDLEIAGVVD
jgi:ClpP class serine protease